MKASIEIECKDADNVMKAIEPDMETEGKFAIKLRSGNGKLMIDVEAKELSGLNAGISSYMRLVKTISSIKD